jgi:hypothetical protein
VSLLVKLGELIGSRRPEAPPPAQRAESKSARMAELQRALGRANRAGDLAEAERLGRELEASL